VPLSKAGAARQHEGVLTKFVAEFGDLEVAHASDFAACNLTRPSSSQGAAVLYMAPSTGKLTPSVSDISFRLRFIISNVTHAAQRVTGP